MSNSVLEPWSKEWVIQQHRAMYHWIADEIKENGVTKPLKKYQHEYLLSVKFNPMFIENYSFLCEYVKRQKCQCPINWVEKSSYPTCDTDFYFLCDLIDKVLSGSYVEELREPIISLVESIAKAPEK